MPKRTIPTKRQIDTALIHVRNALASGALPAHRFDMGRPSIRVQDAGECGTALCIGGWVALVLYRAGLLQPRWKGRMDAPAAVNCAELIADDMTERDYRLYNLLYGWSGKPGPRGAVMAINRYLSGDSNPWRALPGAFWSGDMRLRERHARYARR